MARSGQHRQAWPTISRLWLGTAGFLWRKFKEFCPLEVCGVIAAVSLSWVVFHASGSYWWGAVAGKAAEFVGYYGCAFIREYRRHTEHPLKATFGRLSTFIVAEIFDWALGINLTHIISRQFDNYRLGVFVATIIASVVFTTIVVLTQWLVGVYKRRRASQHAIRALMAEADQPPLAVGATD